MEINGDTLKAPMAVRTCPRCGGKSFTVTTRRRDERLIDPDAIVCDGCGFDTLPVCRAPGRKTFFPPSPIELILFLAAALVTGSVVLVLGQH